MAECEHKYDVGKVELKIHLGGGIVWTRTVTGYLQWMNGGPGGQWVPVTVDWIIQMGKNKEMMDLSLLGAEGRPGYEIEPLHGKWDESGKVWRTITHVEIGERQKYWITVPASWKTGSMRQYYGEEEENDESRDS